MSRPNILIVDDEPDIRETIGDVLGDEGYVTRAAENAEAARRALAEQQPDLVLLDIWMPDTDGISLLKEWMEQGCTASVVMISGHGTVETAVEAIRIGAYDFLEKPLSIAKTLVTIERALKNRDLKQENMRLKHRLEPSTELLGSSAAMNELRRKIQRFALTDNWIVIHGEPGSGKGVATRRLHRQSRRADGPLVSVNLGALPSENVAVHLFGSESPQVRPGSLERADGGTLVLDEVGDVGADLQAKLLSALVERNFLRVGGRTAVEFDVRVIATTNQDLEKKIERGRFRRDLYDRLAELTLETPALRLHREDIPELVEAAVKNAVDAEGYPYRSFSTGAFNTLRNHHWPGNVRELHNLVHRLMIVNESGEITRQDVETALSGELRDAAEGAPPVDFDRDLRDAREAFERAYLTHHLERTGGNVTDLSTRTGLERTHLYRKLKALGIDHKTGKR